MRKLLTCALCCVIASLLCIDAHARKRVITGKVIDSAGTPIPNVSIRLRSAKGGSTTGEDGSFHITAQSSDHLLISNVGYQPQEITVGAEPASTTVKDVAGGAGTRLYAGDIAPVADEFLYDNSYQELYMGLPQENREDFVKGSPLYYAKDLRGNKFQVMVYPNRTHAIHENEGSSTQLSHLFTDYLREHCPGGRR